MGKRNRENKKLTFKNAVAATAEVCNCFQNGKQAIPKTDRNKVELEEESKCDGSLFIDKCLVDQKKYVNDNRWDYVIGYKGEAYFFEVHTAKDSEVNTVIDKLIWLKDWLLQSAPEINRLRANAPFFWIQSNGYHISRNSRHERRAEQSGIKPVPKLILK